jgi:hypothetical protein
VLNAGMLCALTAAAAWLIFATYAGVYMSHTVRKTAQQYCQASPELLGAACIDVPNGLLASVALSALPTNIHVHVAAVLQSCL